MPPVQPEASIVTRGRGLRYIGDYVYAYSNPIGVADTETSLLDTTSGSGIIKCEVVFVYSTQANQNFQYRIYLNELVVFNQFMDNYTGHPYQANQLFAIPLIIPPFTQIKCTAQNITSTDTENQASNLTGRVYGAE